MFFLRDLAFGNFSVHQHGGKGSKVASSSLVWIIWALLSAVFAALTAIFAKVGIQGVDSDLATLVRTVVVIVALALFVWFTGKWSNPFNFSVKTWLFLTLSGLAT